MSDPDGRNPVDRWGWSESARHWWSSFDLKSRITLLGVGATVIVIVVVGIQKSINLPVTSSIPPPTTSGSERPNTLDSAGPGVVWSSGLESGDLRDWAGVSNSGEADSEATSQISRTGDYSLAMTIRNSHAGTGTRVRVDNNVAGYSGAKNLPDDAYYSAWFYIPQHISISGHNGDAWDIFQWKQTHPDGSGGYTRRQLEGLKLRDLGDRYAFTLKSRIMEDGSFGEGSTFIEFFSDDSVTVGAGEWFHVEAHRVYSDDPSAGRLRFWVNGEEIFDLRRQTELTGGQWDDFGDWRRQWTVNNYNTGGHSPDTHSLYVDDARVALDRQGP